jgi:hypothetical protein
MPRKLPCFQVPKEHRKCECFHAVKYCPIFFLLAPYSRSSIQESSTLSVTLQTTSDLETVLRELSELSIDVGHEQGIQGHSLASGAAVYGSWAPPSLGLASLYPPPSNPRHLNSAGPPLIALPSSQDRYSTYPEGHPHGAVLHRPPSQPIGQSSLHGDQRPWSPAFVPSRPATTLGVPGILGEGIYKVSKIGSAASSRPRVRRTSTVLEHQGPRLYTVSKHFDKTLNTADILHSSKARHLGRGLSTSFQTGSSAEQLSGLPSLGALGTESHYNSQQSHPDTQPLTRMSSVLEGVPVNTHHQPRLRRLRTIDDVLNPSLPAGFIDDKGRQSFLSSVAEENIGFSSSQPRPASRARGPVDDAFFFSSSPTLLEPPSNQETGDDWLLQVSQAQHQGLCEASRAWDEFMERAGAEVASADCSRDLSEVLAKYEGEFTRRWEGVVAGTAQKMRGIRAVCYA